MCFKWVAFALVTVPMLLAAEATPRPNTDLDAAASEERARAAAEAQWMMMHRMSGVDGRDSPVIRAMERRGVVAAPMRDLDLSGSSDWPLPASGGSPQAPRPWTEQEYIAHYNRIGATPPPGGYAAYRARMAATGGEAGHGHPSPLQRADALTEMTAHVLPGATARRGRDYAAGEVEVLVSRDPAARRPAPDADDGSGTTTRVYDVAAIDKDIVYTRFGDHDADGMLFVLQEDKARVLACEGFECGHDPLFFGSRRDPAVLSPQPLVIRANVGDVVVINLTNELADLPASIHIHRAVYRADESAGSVTGFNVDTTVQPGETITYRWKIPFQRRAEGIYYFYSHVDPRYQVPHGLFGALVVEPVGSVALDTETGMPLTAGWGAIIANTDPGVPAFREYVVFFQDRILLLDRLGGELVDTFTGASDPGGKGISLRTAPFFNMMELFLDASMAYSAYTFGDVSTPKPRWYVGDPMRVRVVHGGSGEHHVYHNHAHRWRVNPREDPDNLTRPSKSGERDLVLPTTTRIDSQTLGPGEVFDVEMEGGAGGVQRTVGDVLYHCHIIEHVVEGMWSYHRIFNTLQPDLEPLPGRVPPPRAVSSVQLLANAARGRPAVPVSGPFAGEPIVESNIRDWIGWQLPPAGVPDEELIVDPVRGDRTQNKAHRWDWVLEETAAGPLAKGEPYDFFFGPGWPAAGEGVGAGPVGERAELRFNPVDGRLAFPHLLPHLGRRPPFAPIRGGDPDTQGTAYLGLSLEPDSPCWPSGCTQGSGLIPSGAGVRHYDITAIQLPIAYNDFGDIDEQGMIFALADDVDAIRAGSKPAEPLVVRANVGEAVQVTLRSALEEIEEVDFHSKVGMHVHLAQYDVSSSDGAVGGLNYETSVRPSIDPQGDPIEGRRACGRWDPTDCGPLDRSDEVVHTTWFGDVELGTVYWHDHSKLLETLPHGLFAALIVEPEGAEYRDRETGESKYVPDATGRFTSSRGSSGTQFADIILPPTTIDPRTGLKRADFRELFIGTGDATRLFGNFISFSPLDYGESRKNPETGYPSFNLRLEPFVNRLQNVPDETLVYSSAVHGDPATPLLLAYLGDPVSLRVEAGGTSSVHVVNMHGHRWRFQRGDPASSPLRDFVVSGVSEGFTFDLEPDAGGLAAAPGDYLYVDGDMDHRQEGMWGLFRVYDTAQPDLKPLVDRPAPPPGPGFFEAMMGRPLTPEGRPVPAPEAGDPGAPPGAPVRSYDIAAIEVPIPYDAAGYTDVFGRMFVLAADEADVLAGRKATEPLVIRANAGDVIEINLANHLSGNRVGLHASLVQYDVRGSDGATVGWNPDQSVAPGDTITYRWYADQELGTVYLYSPSVLDDTRHGLFGALIVEPEGSTYHDPVTGAEIDSGWAADIYPGVGAPYREFALFFHDGVDQIRYGVAINFRTARRLGANEVLPGGPAGVVRIEREDTVHSSEMWGDPVTPLLRAYTGDRVIIRQLQPTYSDHHVFHLHGHSWHLEPGDTRSNVLSSITLGVGSAYDLELIGGARTGDHLYHCHIQDHKAMGMWGLFRVHDEPQPDLQPLAR